MYIWRNRVNPYSGAMMFEAVIFDMDGTLTIPAIDFAKLREEIGCQDEDIIDGINMLPVEARGRAWEIVERHEKEAMRNLRLTPGVPELMRKLDSAGLRKGLLTRNSRSSFDEFAVKTGFKFDIVVDRSFPFLKPHPGAVIHMLGEWKIHPSRALVVGDYIHDIHCGKAAGASTCLLLNENNRRYGEIANFAVPDFFALDRIIFE